MKRILFLLLYLSIYTSYFFVGVAQDLNLEITAEKKLTDRFKDSLDYTRRFDDFLSLKKEADTLLYTFQKMGFIESTLDSLQKKNDSVIVAHYFLGSKYSKVKIFYDSNVFSKNEIAKISETTTDTFFVVPIEILETTLQKLNSTQTQKGDAFAKLRLSNFSTEGDFLTAHLVAENDQLRTVDSIVVKGYEKFPKAFLSYYAGIKRGKPFNKEKLLKQNELLNSLAFANSVRPPEVLFREKNTTAYFYLEKANNNVFDGILGFATNEDTQKLQFNGYLNLELNNNLNYGERFTINYKADGNEQQNFFAAIKLPYLFKTPLGIGAELQIFKRDSSFVTTAQGINLSYQASPRISTTLGYQGYESNNLLDENEAGLAVEDYSSKFLTVGSVFEQPSNSLLFRHTTYIDLQVGIGERERQELTDDQIKGKIAASHIFSLNDNNVIYLRNISEGLFSDSYLTNELVRFGGINSIRGFNENSIDASIYTVINTEYRYLFNPTIYIHSIIDAGYYENEVINLKQKLYSFGIGFGLATNAGILRLSIANGITEENNFSFNNSKIHLSLNASF